MTRTALFTGTWQHLFGPGNTETLCRIVIDSGRRELVAAQAFVRQGWVELTQREWSDLAESLFGANDVHQNPQAWDLARIETLPRWSESTALGQNEDSSSSSYLQTLPLQSALWWFIENGEALPGPARTEAFFALRERVRQAPAEVGEAAVKREPVMLYIETKDVTGREVSDTWTQVEVTPSLLARIEAMEQACAASGLSSVALDIADHDQGTLFNIECNDDEAFDPTLIVSANGFHLAWQGHHALVETNTHTMPIRLLRRMLDTDVEGIEKGHFGQLLRKDGALYLCQNDPDAFMEIIKFDLGERARTEAARLARPKA